MINFGNLLSKENLFQKVNNYQILKFYLPQIEVGRVINSPLRNDKNASFSMFNYRGDALVKDFANNSIYNGVTFVMELYNVSYFEAVSIINRDMNLGMYDNNVSTKNSLVKHDSVIVGNKPKEFSSKVIKISSRKWEAYDGDFWSPYGITAQQLIKSNTIPIKYYWINDSTTILADKHAYAYMFYEHQGIMRIKIYQPYNESWKWVTNLNSTVVDGIKEIPKSGDLLIITKSRKDRLVLNNLGYNAISVNNEGSFLPDEVFEKLLSRFTRIVLFFDNDEAGLKNGKKFAELYDIEYIHIPVDYEEKDISDFRKAYGEKLSKELLTKLINDE